MRPHLGGATGGSDDGATVVQLPDAARRGQPGPPGPAPAEGAAELIRHATFTVVERGYAPHEVEALLARLAVLVPPPASAAPGARPALPHPSVAGLSGADRALFDASREVLHGAWERAKEVTDQAERARDVLLAEAAALAGARVALEEARAAYLHRASRPAEAGGGG